MNVGVLGAGLTGVAATTWRDGREAMLVAKAMEKAAGGLHGHGYRHSAKPDRQGCSTVEQRLKT
jgi:hypothetical protein